MLPLLLHLFLSFIVVLFFADNYCKSLLFIVYDGFELAHACSRTEYPTSGNKTKLKRINEGEISTDLNGLVRFNFFLFSEMECL